MKRLSYIVTFLVITAGVFQWLSRSYATTWEPRLRSQLEKTASRITHKKVRIDTIALAFKSIRLINIRATDPSDSDRPPLFEVSQVEFSFSLLGLPKAILNKEPMYAIGSVHLENPRVRLTAGDLPKMRSSGKRFTLPPWFTLSWQGGTFQWLDEKAPHGRWTLYQTEGSYRVRGPQQSVSIAAVLEQAERVSLEASTLRKRWKAHAKLTGGRLQETIDLLASFSGKPVLPAAWTATGTYQLHAQMSGRSIPVTPQEWLASLRTASLKLDSPADAVSTSTQAVVLQGSWSYENHRISTSKFSFKSPVATAIGSADITLSNTVPIGLVTIRADLDHGLVGQLPFKKASLHLSYAHGKWESHDSEIPLLGGRVQVKGISRAEGNDLSITADSLALDELTKKGSTPIFAGRLNTACTLRGTWKDFQLTGGWWLTDGAWGRTPLGEAKGDLEVTPKRFFVHGKSETTKFRISLAGHKTPESLYFDDVNLTLPSDATATLEGRYTLAPKSMHLTWTISHANLASDVPGMPLSEDVIRGTVSARGEIGGTLQDPRMSATLTSSGLVLYKNDVGPASAAMRFEKGKLSFPSFSLGTAISGSWVRDQGIVRLDNAVWGKTKIENGRVEFETAPQLVRIKSVVLRNKKTELTGQAKTSWHAKGSSGLTLTEWSGKGQLTVRGSTQPVQVPIAFEGELLSGSEEREGTITFSATLLKGHLQGKYQRAGTLADPRDHVTARLTQAQWRAFPISADLNATWSREGLKPLHIEGHVATGGDFELIGQLSNDAHMNGTFALKDLNLKTLGESLHFPKPIAGKANATLTVTGPLASPKWTGTFLAGPLVYAAGMDHPFKLDVVLLNMTLAELPENEDIMRLTLTEGEAKTSEALIRFHKGSYVEFAGQAPARLVLGTDLRNLHLGTFTLFGGLGLEGTWQIKPAGFAIQTKAQTRSLFINNYELEEGILQADFYDGELKFSAPPNSASLITGTVQLKKAPQLHITDLFISGKYEQGLAITGDLGPNLWDFKMEGRGLDIGTLSELAGFPYPLGGAANLRIVGRGDAKHPHVEGIIELDRGSILGLSYQTGTATFVWEDDRISFTKLFLHEPGRYGLEGAGVFPLKKKSKAGKEELPATPIDFSIRLKDANLSLLKSFSQEVLEAKGPLEGLLQIKGTLDDPQLSGSLKLTGGDVTGAHYLRRLRGGTLSIDFNDKTIYVRDVRGKSGDGEFRGSGKIELTSGFAPASYDLKLAVVSDKGVEIQVPELAIPDSPLAKKLKFLTTVSRVDVRGQVSLRGPAESPTFSGDGIFSNGHFTFPPSQKKPGKPSIIAWFRRIYWDVNLKFQDGAWFENELVQANVTGQMAIKGPSSQLEVDGGLDIGEGRISYLGLQFDIQQARFDIRSEKSGDRVINVPYVRGVAESEIQAVDTVSGTLGGSRLSVNDTITLNIDYAPISQIKPRLTSAVNPTMTQEKLLARVTNTDTENLTVQERNYLYQKQLVTLIDTSLTTPLAQNVLKKAGIADRLRAQHVFDPNTVTGGDLNTTSGQQQNSAVNLLANTKYTVEKDLSNRLSMGYGVRFIQSAQVNPELQEKKLDLVSDVQLSYRWFKNVFLRGSFDLPTSAPGILPDRRVTIEPRWRFGWWGNTNREKKK